MNNASKVAGYFAPVAIRSSLGATHYSVEFSADASVCYEVTSKDKCIALCRKLNVELRAAGLFVAPQI